MKRVGMVIGIHPDRLDEYKRLHADVWPGVIDRLRKSNIENFSIFLREPENLLFGYWEYTGTAYEADLAAIAADPVTQEWWSICGPCQLPLTSRSKGEHWATMEQIFYLGS